MEFDVSDPFFDAALLIISAKRKHEIRTAQFDNDTPDIKLFEKRLNVFAVSFDNKKNYYLLDKVKVKTQATEIAWIFFGILTANAAIISNLIAQIKKTGLILL